MKVNSGLSGNKTRGSMAWNHKCDGLSTEGVSPPTISRHSVLLFHSVMYLLNQMSHELFHLLLSDHLFQLYLGHPGVFPSQLIDVVSPLGLSWGLSLMRHVQNAPWKSIWQSILNQMPKLPELSLFNVEEKLPNFQLLLGDDPFSRHSHFMTIGESWIIDWELH